MQSKMKWLALLAIIAMVMAFTASAALAAPLCPVGAPDSDFDGLCNAAETVWGTNPNNPDTDADGLRDGLDEDVSANGVQDPGETNPTKWDTDGDGMPDGWEKNYGLLPLDPTDAGGDLDSDNLSNLTEFQKGTNPTKWDTDNDGLSDSQEVVQYGTDPLNPDTDGDTLLDGAEVTGGTNPKNADTDGDGMGDAYEVAHTCLKPTVADATADADTDGLNNIGEMNLGTDPCDPDTDGDGMTDGFEASNSCLKPMVADGTPADGDGDGLTNYDEFLGGTNPCAKDTDGDGMLDNFEWYYGGFSGQPSCLKPTVADANADPDDDGASNMVEYKGKDGVAAPVGWAPTGDFSNPCGKDTDQDGLEDGYEYANACLNPVGAPGAADDSDGDGALNSDEVAWGTDPCNSDTDGDALGDRYEMGTSLTDPLKPDTDGDGIGDAFDWYYGGGGGGSCLKAAEADGADDFDADGLTNKAEYLGEDGLPALGFPPDPTADYSNPCVADTDGDGLPDGFEVDNACLSPINTDPGDFDLEGLSNVDEFLGGTDPCAQDTDADGMLDNFEWYYGGFTGQPSCLLPTVADASADPDGDGVSNMTEYKGKDGVAAPVGFAPTGDFSDPCVVDTDADGMDDGYEYANACLNPVDPTDAAGDADSDGATSITEFNKGTDPCDADTDDDGMTDNYEIIRPFLLDGVTACLNPLVDDAAADPDKDGLTSAEEYNKSEPCNPDTDTDGIDDGFEVKNAACGFVVFGQNDANTDFDGDGLRNIDEYTGPDGTPYTGDETDPCKADTDGDGLPDRYEWIRSCLNPRVADADADPDKDGLTNIEEFNVSEPCSYDTDGDGMDDGYEVKAAAGGCMLDVLVKDDGGDLDGDGLKNIQEYLGRDEVAYSGDETLPCDKDTDDDGMPDKYEYTRDCLNPVVADADADPDKDGLTNAEERALGTDPCDADTDGDGMPDGYEAAHSGMACPTNGVASVNGGTCTCLNPLVADADGDVDHDGVINIDEMKAGTDPCDADSDDDGWTDGEELNDKVPAPYPGGPHSWQSCDPLKADTDGDGLDDWEEGKLGKDGYTTDCSKPDTDDGGVSDYTEWQLSEMGFPRNPQNGIDDGYDLDGDGLPDAAEMGVCPSMTNPDSDFDGLKDGAEIALGTDPCKADTDGDRIMDGDEVNFTHTDPLKPDTDGDGLGDFTELFATHTDPLKPDTDGDGLSDGAEVNTHGTDPNKADTDGDGLSDGAEVNTHGTNPKKVDTDSDGMPDGYEVMYDCLKPTVVDANADPDGDGYTNIQEYQMGTNPCVYNCNLMYDWDQDGEVTVNDVLMMVPSWGAKPGSPNWVAAYDVDGDGTITVIDFMKVVNQIGDVCNN